ncbi:MAG TPA: hypothetical protein VK066_04965 [Chloroflexota bacterium]|nr:hypothetical protein [Chloroflexota bacterium]
MADDDRAAEDAGLAEYRARWEQRHAGQGEHWEDYAAAYRFARDLAHTPGIEYGRSWADVAPEFQRQWTLHGSGQSWDSVADLMREVWEDASDDGRLLLEGEHRAPEPERHPKP